MLKAVAGKHEGKTLKGEFQELPSAQQCREILQDEAVDIFIHFCQMVGIGNASNFNTVIQVNLGIQ